MNSQRIKEIQEQTAFPESLSVKQALLQVWNECQQEHNKQLILSRVSQQRKPLLAYHKYLDSFNDPTIYNATESMIDDYLANNCG
jgi:hypothetical protein